jgi:hypothetical protein
MNHIHVFFIIKIFINTLTKDLLIELQGILELIRNSQNTNLRHSFGIENQLKKLWQLIFSPYEFLVRPTKIQNISTYFWKFYEVTKIQNISTYFWKFYEVFM